MLNHVTIMGRLTRDPEIRRTGSGTAVSSFSLACDRDYAKPNEERETDFIDCTVWGNTAEFFGKFFRKGMMAVVTGRLQIRGWTDKDGNKRRSAEINVSNLYFGEGKRKEAQEEPVGSQFRAEDPYGDTMAAIERYQNGGFGVIPEDEQLPF